MVLNGSDEEVKKAREVMVQRRVELKQAKAAKVSSCRLCVWFCSANNYTH